MSKIKSLALSSTDEAVLPLGQRPERGLYPCFVGCRLKGTISVK